VLDTGEDAVPSSAATDTQATGDGKCRIPDESAYVEKLRVLAKRYHAEKHTNSHHTTSRYSALTKGLPIPDKPPPSNYLAMVGDGPPSDGSRHLFLIAERRYPSEWEDDMAMHLGHVVGYSERLWPSIDQLYNIETGFSLAASLLN
jgi:hypothetical protein